MDQQQRQLPVRFFSKLYCATSEIDILARRFSLTSNRYILRESANVKVSKYQIMISDSLFDVTIFSKYLTINYVLNFLYVIFPLEISPYERYVIMTK